MRCSAFLNPSALRGILRLLLFVAFGIGWCTAPDVFAATSPRPYVQSLGTQTDVIGTAVAPNGYSFILLADGTIAVLDAAQVVRTPITIPGLTSPRAIATSSQASLSNDITVKFYVATATQVWLVNYDTSTGQVTDRSFTTHTLTANRTTVAMAVQPTVNGSVFVCGTDRNNPAVPKNFVLKLSSVLDSPSYKVWGQDQNIAGNFESQAQNQVHAIAAAADGSVYVSGQWDAVYSRDQVTYGEYISRARSWSIGNAGLAPLTNTIQASITTYTTLVALGPLTYKHAVGNDSVNRTGYIVKFNSSLAPTAYTNTTSKVGVPSAASNPFDPINRSTFHDIRIAPNNFIYAACTWEGTSSYGTADNVALAGYKGIEVVRFDSTLAPQSRAAAKALSSGNQIHSLDLDGANNVYVSGVLDDPTTTFTGTSTQPVAGRGYFFAQLNSNLSDWRAVNRSNAPAPAVLGKTVTRWNSKSQHAEFAGTFFNGQLSLGVTTNPGLLPLAPSPGYTNFYLLGDDTGNLVGQYGVTVRSDFVTGNQVTVTLGDAAPAPLKSFDPVIREGGISLLSSSAGTIVTVRVPPRVYYDKFGNQVFPDFDPNNNEIAPAAAVTRHICTGFSVTGEATTGATNTYTFVLSGETKVIFNWRTEHALEVESAVTSDLGLPESAGLALGNPEPVVNKTWIPENQPVTTFIDGSSSELAVVGKRFRVTGFDATGSALDRPVPLPVLPDSRTLLTAKASVTSGSTSVTLAEGAVIEVGWVVTGDGIPTPGVGQPPVTVVAKSGLTQFTLSTGANATNPNAKLTFSDSLVTRSVATSLVSGSNDVTLAVPTGVKPGWLVSGPSIPLGTSVTAVTDATHVTLSKAPEALGRVSKTTVPPVVATFGVESETTSGSTTLTVPGGTPVAAGMTVTGTAVASGTTVTAVANVTTTISTRLVSGSPNALVPYAPLNPPLSPGNPLSGTTNVPAGTTIASVDEETIAVKTTTTNGVATANVPATPDLRVGNIVRGTGIASGADTTITSITPVTRSVQTSTSNSSTVATVSPLAGADLVIGALVSGIGITAGTQITAINPETTSLNATISNNDETVTVLNTDALREGDAVTGSGIPADTYILVINGASSFTLTKKATGVGSRTLTFTRRRLTLSNAANPGGLNTLTYTIGRTLGLSRNAGATVSTPTDFTYVTDLKLTLSNSALTTVETNVGYTTARTLTISQAALVTDARNLLTYAPVVPNTATTVTVVSTNGLAVGMQVTGPGIPANTTVAAIVNETTLTLSQGATEEGTANLQFFAPTATLTFDANFGSYAFDQVRDRQQVPQWLMSGPAVIRYRWSTQYSVRVSTSVQAAQTFPEIRSDDPSVALVAGSAGFGTGEHWFDAGSRIYIGSRFGGGASSRQLLGWLNATMPPFASDQGTIDADTSPVSGTRGSPTAFYYTEVLNLQAPATVLWNYGGTIRRETVVIGRAATFVTTPALSPAQLATAQNQPPDRRTIVEGPSGSSPAEMALWDPNARKLYPVRPGKVLYEYGSTADPTIVEITSTFPTAPDFLHLTHPDLPGIVLDPSNADAIAFQQLAFSGGNGTVTNGGFLATQNGQSTLVFTVRDPSDTTPANGDQTKEKLVVKVVQTRQWDEVIGAGSTPAVIGQKLTRPLPPPATDILTTGFVVHPNARYNAAVYDRTRIIGSGPIIPVNQQFTGLAEDELVVIWFSPPDLQTGIVWTNSVERFSPQWPATPPRIVLASRLGSEGKDAAGADQLSFAADRFEGVQIYNQPDRTAPGFNPNEEHAVIAPSFKFSDQANPPPTAYALQTGGLNVRHDTSLATDPAYTSEPYVLVQYFDKQAKEAKMAVYSLQAEDPKAVLNPDVDARTGRRFNYTFDYTMTVAEPVQPPYPLARVIGFGAMPETFGLNTSNVRAYWEDYGGVAYAAGQGAFSSYFYYPLAEEFWFGEGGAERPVGTSVPFGTAGFNSLIKARGTVVNTGGAKVFTGTTASPSFTIGHSFTIDTGRSSGPVTIRLTGQTMADFVSSVINAFPDGELIARSTTDNKLEFVVYGGASLTIGEDPRLGFSPDFGNALETAGFLTALDPAAPQTVTLTNGSPISPGFIPGNKFIVDIGLPPASVPTTVTLTGATSQDFVNAVNAAFPDKRVVASLTSAGRIELTGNSIPALKLTNDTGTPLAAAGLREGVVLFPAQEVRYFARWPANPPILKAGETLTFSGGEYRADHPTAPGLPGVIGWAAGEVLFDSLNPAMRSAGPGVTAFTNYTARLISPLEPRRVLLGDVTEAASVTTPIQPSTGKTSVSGTVWKFNNLPASLARRLFYDPLRRELGILGFVNDKTLGDSTLTAAPPPVYVLEPNILTRAEKQAMLDIPELASNPVWVNAVEALFALSRNPNELTNGADAGQTPYYVGLQQAYQRDAATGEIKLDANGEPLLETNSAMPQKFLGPGLALVPSPAFLDPANPLAEGYVTLVENNDETIGGPVTLRVIKVSRNDRYRGAIKTVLTDNVFSEQITLRHTGDFGANADDIVYQWFYREEDGSEAPLPPGGLWQLFPDTSNSEPRGLGLSQIELKGNPILLLADQLIFARYRHKDEVPAGGPNSTNWAGTKWEEYGSEFAGAANSRPGAYQPQLAQGWIKRVLDRINPYEARFNDFRNNTAPASYSSMILQAGQRFEGPVALNPDKDVVENVGLIELYQTVLDRGRGLSIDLSSPVNTPGINNALMLAATRISDLYLLLGNEAYSDAQDPTIGFGSTSADYGSAAPSIFTFQNQVPTLLDEELALLRGEPQSYGRPVYNRLFWNFTKSEGEVAYAMNYNVTDQNRDGFIDEKDAMLFHPQGHGDAWGHYLTAIKSQYSLLRHPYFNWVSRSEFYNLLDVAIKVDFLDERKFADAAAARAKAGAEVVNMTYRSRYVEDPDGQWQGYADTDSDRAWGVDEWARRAGQGAYFDWITANALLPSSDTTRSGIQKVDRSTVTSIHNVSAQLGKIQGTMDDAGAGVNPLGLAADVVPMDFDPTLITPSPFAQSHFEQMAARAETALANAVKIFDNASQQGNRLRMQATTTATFTQQTYEQDRDYRNRLIEIFGTPYSGQIGAGKAYPTGYNGPDIALYMYVDVNDLNADTVPKSSESGGFQDYWNSLPQLVALDPKSISIGSTTVTVEPQFTEVFNRYFMNDVLGGTPTGLGKVNSPGVFDPAQMAAAYDSFTSVESYWHALSVADTINLPAQASDYTFQAPPEWGKRSAPGEVQAVISELVQAQATLGLAVADYDAVTLELQTATKVLRAQHDLDSATILVRDKVRSETKRLNKVIAGLESFVDLLELAADSTVLLTDAAQEYVPEVVGTSTSAGSPAKGGIKLGGAIASTVIKSLALAPTIAARAQAVDLEDLQMQADYEIEKAGFEQDIREKLGEIEIMLWNEAAQRVTVFKRLEEMRQVSDRYRSVLQKGLALLDERADFNRKAGGVGQQLRYQDMGFRVFRNDGLQKYRASFDLAARYTYLAAKAYDYETNLDPNDPASAWPLLQDIVRARTLGVYQNGSTNAGGGLSASLATLKANYAVLKGRLGLNNPQIETSGFSLKDEQARTSSSGWRQLLQNSRKDDLWTVPEFRRYCRPPVARSAGKLPGLVIPFSTQTVFGRNFFGNALAAGDVAFNPTNFANKIASVGLHFQGYPVSSLAATPQAYLVPAGVDVLTVPNSPSLETRTWSVLDQALPVPFPVGNDNLKNPNWIPATDGLTGPLAEIRRFSSFRAGITAGAPPLASDTRLAGRSVWNTNWLLIIPGGSMLNDGDAALTQFINNVTDIKLYLSTYGYSGN